MNTQAPISGNEPALPKSARATHRVTFDVDGDFLQEAQNVLLNAPKRMEHLAAYMQLLRDLTLSSDYDTQDPRLIAAFEIGTDAARMMVHRDGQMLSELFELLDEERNIGRVG